MKIERHRCFIRWILALTESNGAKGKDIADQFLARVAKRHGDVYVDFLRKELRDQWTKGNRGQCGDWR